MYGSRVAVPHLTKHSGALINVASALADRAIPPQGNYCAAKHARAGLLLAAATGARRRQLPMPSISRRPPQLSIALVGCPRSFRQ